MTKKLVMKFGGTSVGSIPAIRQIIEIVRHAQTDWDNVAVVVSAMSGVTDSLLNGAMESIKDEKSSELVSRALREKHFNALAELANASQDTYALIASCLDEYVTLCRASQVLGEISPRALDVISSLGERMSAPLVTAALNEGGIDISAQTYKEESLPVALTKLPLIATQATVDMLLQRMEEALSDL